MDTYAQVPPKCSPPQCQGPRGRSADPSKGLPRSAELCSFPLPEESNRDRAEGSLGNLSAPGTLWPRLLVLLTCTCINLFITFINPLVYKKKNTY